MRATVRAASRPRRAARRPASGLTAPEIERMLTWLGGELCAERIFAWYQARRPYTFIRDCPPGAN